MSTPNETAGSSDDEGKSSERHTSLTGGDDSGDGGTLGTPSRSGRPSGGADDTMVVSGGGVADPDDDESVTSSTHPDS